MMMLGGVSELQTDVRPEREALMAFAGPLASFAIAVTHWLKGVPFWPATCVLLWFWQ